MPTDSTKSPATLASKVVVADVFLRQGRFGEVLLFEDLICLLERAYGDERRETFRAYEIFATAYSQESRHHEAEHLWQTIVGASEKKFGENHSQTLVAKGGLAFACYQSGNYGKAMELADVVSRKFDWLEEGEETTSLGNYCLLVLIDQNRVGEAKKLGQHIFDSCKRLFGTGHPTTTLFMSRLGSIHRSQGRLDLAAHLFVEELSTNAVSLGRDHHATLITTYNLAVVRMEQGLEEMARAGMRSIAKQLETMLGSESPYAIHCKQYLPSIEHAATNAFPSPRRPVWQLRTRCSELCGRTSTSCERRSTWL